MPNFEQDARDRILTTLNQSLTDFTAQSSENYVDAGYTSPASLSASKAEAANYTYVAYDNPNYPTRIVDNDRATFKPAHGYLLMPIVREAAYLAATQEQKDAIYLQTASILNSTLEMGGDTLSLLIAKIDDILA